MVDFSVVGPGALVRGPRQSSYTLTKWAKTDVYVQAPVDSFRDLTFQVSDLQENGAFLIMWSQYMIRKVEMDFRPMFRANSVREQAAIAIPLIYLVFDSSGATVPTTLPEYERFAGLVTQDDSESFHVTFEPRIATPVYDGVITTAYSVPKGRTWLSTAFLSIPHYSLHVAIGGSGNVAGPFQAWNVTTRYTIDVQLER